MESKNKHQKYNEGFINEKLSEKKKEKRSDGEDDILMISEDDIFCKNILDSNGNWKSGGG